MQRKVQKNVQLPIRQYIFQDKARVTPKADPKPEATTNEGNFYVDKMQQNSPSTTRCFKSSGKGDAAYSEVEKNGRTMREPFYGDKC